MNQTNFSKNDRRDSIPFDIRTLALGVLKRWRFIITTIFLFCCLGIAGGLTLGDKVYEAQTVLLYKPESDLPQNEVELSSALEGNTTLQYRRGGSDGETNTHPSDVKTLLHMVKLPNNLEEVRKRLNLAINLDRFGSLFDITVQKDTSLLFIFADWKNPQVAADMANILRDVFIENLQKLQKTELEKKIPLYEKRLNDAEAEFQDAFQKVQDFLNANKIANIDDTLKYHLSEQTSYDREYEIALQERSSLKLKMDDAQKIMQDMKNKSEEEAKNADPSDNLAELNIKVAQLRESIYEDKDLRANQAILAQKETDLIRAQRLFEQQMISQVDYDKAKSEYDKQKALTVDTDQIKKWRDEMHKTQADMLPKDKKKKASSSLLEDMTNRLIDFQLELVSIEERIKYIESIRQSIKEKIDQLPQLQRQYAQVSRKANSLEAEKRLLEDALIQARQNLESNKTGFQLVSEAKPPILPIKSTRRIIAAAIALFGFILAFGGVFLFELFDTTIRSASDASLKLELPILGVIPKLPASHPALPEKNQFSVLEPFRLIAQRIRQAIPEPGARILIVSATPQEGKTLVTANLAVSLGRQDEHVLVIDTNVRSEQSHNYIMNMIGEDAQDKKGLGEYLSYETDRIDDVVWPAPYPGVECLPRVGEAVIPDLLGSNRMNEMLKELSGKFSILLLDAPAALPHVDAALMASWCDGIVLVVRCRYNSASTIRSTIAQLQETGTPILGVVLNSVESIYLENAYERAVLYTDYSTA